MRSSSADRRYRVYGCSVASRWELPCLRDVAKGAADIRFVSTTHPPRPFPSPDGRSLAHARLEDGSDHLSWPGLFEFVVSPDGRRIECATFEEATPEAFETYALSPVLSFALVKLGIEPIHATVVAVDGRAVGFMADPGTGKSTLAAAFLETGHALLTDDLLVLRKDEGGFLAQAGIPRIKLFPETAARFLGALANGGRMNPYTQKKVIPLGEEGFQAEEAALDRLYSLRMGRSDRITIRPLSGRRAFLDITHNTFNSKVSHAARLKEQFLFSTELARSILVRSVTYPRDLGRVPEVRDRILRDLGG